MLNSFSYCRSSYLRSFCKLIVPAVALTSFLLLSSCHNGESIKPAMADSAAKQKSPDSLHNSGLAFGDTQLYVLYTSSQELLGILNVNPNRHKLVFQFFSTKAGKISLTAFVGRKVKDGNNKKTKFDSTHTLLLKISSDAPANCDISGKDVLLSSQELNIKNDDANGQNDIDTLKTFLGSHLNVFITFTPCLKVGNNGIYKIHYKIEYSDSEPQKSIPISKKKITDLLNTNPTPPRNSY